ncbi:MULTISPECIES: hypothetical protein [unclassified Cupriavidus]|uniref:hypothetical protein n=1 Tax=unclassified Cupriavidus TaxID=2640874 RepID=UPI00313B2B46
MIDGRVLWLSDRDFKPELIADESIPVQYRLLPEAFDASLGAHVLLWGDRVIKNVHGRSGHISDVPGMATA